MKLSKLHPQVVMEIDIVHRKYRLKEKPQQIANRYGLTRRDVNRISNEIYKMLDLPQTKFPINAYYLLLSKCLYLNMSRKVAKRAFIAFGNAGIIRKLMTNKIDIKKLSYEELSNVPRAGTQSIKLLRETFKRTN